MFYNVILILTNLHLNYNLFSALKWHAGLLYGNLLWIDFSRKSSMDDSAEFVLAIRENQMHRLKGDFLGSLQVSLAPVSQDGESALFVKKGSLRGYRHRCKLSVNTGCFLECWIGWWRILWIKKNNNKSNRYMRVLDPTWGLYSFLTFLTGWL